MEDENGDNSAIITQHHNTSVVIIILVVAAHALSAADRGIGCEIDATFPVLSPATYLAMVLRNKKHMLPARIEVFSIA